MNSAFETALGVIVVTGVCLIGAAALPRKARTSMLDGFARLSRRQFAVALAGLAALLIAVRVACLPIVPQPHAVIPDEQSHLLLAETLAAGRFANPPHPMWRHFETLFVLHRPTYASVYPPVQGVLLACGLVLFGNPWAGVLLGTAVMCAAIVWMLRAYLPRPWALYGGVLAACGYGVLSYWTNSFWGGTGAAIGGALVFGGLPRMLARWRGRDAALLGVGLVTLANSRPYEGLLAALPVAFCIAYHFRSARNGRPWRGLALLSAAMLAGAILTCCYNWSVTGSPFRLPYTAYIEQYAAAPAFLWQAVPRIPPEYGDRVLRDAHVSFRQEFDEYSTFAGAAGRSFRKLARIGTFYLGPFWALVLLALPDLLRERRFRVALWSLSLCLGGILLTVGFQTHYAAPCTSVFLLLLVGTFRRVYRQWRSVGAILLIAAPAAWIAMEALDMTVAKLPNSLDHRPAVQARITAEPGRHLVFVHYGPSHPLGQEWVYNGPDIDGSRTVWARDLGPQRNRELIRYYPERRLWLVEPDYPVPRVSSYPDE